MQVSTRTEYGLRCLLLLARQGEGKALSLSEITQKEHLSKHYVEQILLRLRRADFVKSTRGTQGGFALSRPASDISIGSIIRALEKAPLTDTCNHFNRRTDCGHLGDCSIRPIWETIAKRLWDSLDQISLQHLISDERTVNQTLGRQLPVLTLP